MNTAPPRSDDDARTRSDEPEPARAGRPRRPIPPDSRTSDEINAMLSSSLEKPEPDPMLGGSSSVDLQEDAGRGPNAPRTSDGLDFDVRFAGSSSEIPTAQHPHPRSELWNVALKSYASAVTLALIWVLWTGRTARPPEPTTPQREAPSARRRTVDVEPPVAIEAPTPGLGVRPSPLRKAIVLGDLEVTPLTVLQRDIQASRKQDGQKVRAVTDRNCLVLTLRIKNLGNVDALTPIAAQDLWNTASFAIEAPPGAPIAMYTTGLRAEWTIDEQAFPTIEPGESEDVMLVSEPLPAARLTSAMVWRFRVATDPDRTQKADVAVGFDRNDVHDGF